MRCRKNVGRALAGILAVGLLVSSMPSAVYAVENESSTDVVAEQDEPVSEENGEEAGQESTGTEAAEKEDGKGNAGQPEQEKEDNESGEETADSTDNTPEEEDKENQEEIETDLEQTEEEDEAGNAGEVETEREADYKIAAAEVMEAEEAETSGSCGNNLTWRFEDGVLTISGSGAMYDYDSPYGENSPCAPWYKYHRINIERVVVEEGVTTIGEYAFFACHLTSIELPSSVTTIGEAAFEYCRSLTSIKLPSGVTTIEREVFYDCLKLTSIELPSNVTSIGESAFEYCVSLTSIKLPAGITTIERKAFRACRNLTSIEIPLGVTTIGWGAFSGCSSLTDVYYGGSESDWLSITIDDSIYNEPLISATIHYNHTGSLPKGEYKVYINYPGYEIFDVSLDYKVKKTPATTYDPQLAHMLIAMCNSVHNEKDMEATFDSFGFAADYTKTDYSLEDVLLAYGLGIKLMDDGTVLVLAVARGTKDLDEDFAEWWSNIAEVGTNSSGEHTGFSNAASGLYDTMIKFLNTKGKSLKPDLDTENFSDIKFVLTGHSRGAAAVNIVGKRLADLRNGEDENIYVYTFACPDVAVVTAPHAAKYPTIFNIANVKDVVPWVPRAVMPASGEIDGWGRDSYWDKYGYSYWFCDNWNDYSRDNRVSIDAVGSLSQYHPQDKYLAYLRAEKRKSEYRTREKTEEVTDLAFFGIVGGTFQILNKASEMTNPIVRFFKSLCPIDIEVYASDGRLVGKVVDNIASDVVEDEIYVYVDGDSKYVGFIGEDTYLIKMIGTDTGTMEYAVQDVNARTFEIVAEKSFKNVVLTAGKQMTSQVSVWDKEDVSIDTEGKIDIPEVQLLVLDDKGNAVKEVLPDGEGTEISYTESTDSDGVLPEDLPADGKIPEGLWIAGVKESYTYTGTAIKPEIRVYDGKKRLQPGQDYTASYKNNTKVNDAAKISTAPTITVKGKGNYAGSETATFWIMAVDLGDSVVHAEDITVAYNKKVQKKVPVVTYNGKKLAANRDFAVSYPDGGDGAYKDAGVYDILLTAKSGGNFSGTRTVKCTITENTLLSKVSVKKIPAQVYTGEAIEPELTVTYKGAPLIKDTDYSVSYTDNTEIGKAKAILTGIGKYAGTKNVPFSITGTSLKGASVSGIENKIYNGNDQEQRFTVMLKGKTLTEGTDYDVSYEKNKNVGKASVTIKGKGAYTGTIKKTFTIGKFNVAVNADGGFEVKLEQDVVPYAKGGAKPDVTVRFKTGDGKWETLAEGQDYTLSYRNHTAVNDGSNQNKQPVVTLKGKGSFSGTYGTAFTYKIVAQDMGQLTMTAQDKTYQNKKNIYPTKITITDLDGKALKPGTDYNKVLTYSYANETTVNTAGNGTIVRAAGASVDKNDIIPAGTILKVKADAKSGGNYTGTLTGEYRIAQAAITSASVSVPKQIYTGRAITLEKNQITVKIKGKQLDESQYEIVSGSYRNNVKKGTATVKIRGLDNYGGTKDVRFTIKAKGFLWWWR